MIVSWLGDSQVVLCKAGQAIQLMEPHKPDRQVGDNVFGGAGVMVEFLTPNQSKHSSIIN